MGNLPRPKPTQQLLDLLGLVKSGRLFDLQRRLQTDADVIHSEVPAHCPLLKAMDIGFHSMVEILLNVGGWKQDRLNLALGSALEAKRIDLVELLLSHGANAAAVSFELVCRTAEPSLIERFLRSGSDPSKGNAFARALSETKARPLLRFYRSLKGEFPALHTQASLALAEAIGEGKSRWAALLVWAGADPFMAVPYSLDESWDFGEEGGQIPAHAVCWCDKPDMIKALNLKPTPQQALELIERAVSYPRIEVVRTLLKKVPKHMLNSGTPLSCKAVEKLVGHSEFSCRHFGHSDGTRDAAACLELLLDAGAKWRPNGENIKYARRSFSQHSSDYIIRILRLLVYTYGAADPEKIIELCWTPTIRTKIASADKDLIRDLEALRKRIRFSVDEVAKTDTVP